MEQQKDNKLILSRFINVNFMVKNGKQVKNSFLFIGIIVKKTQIELNIVHTQFLQKQRKKFLKRKRKIIKMGNQDGILIEVKSRMPKATLKVG